MPDSREQEQLRKQEVTKLNSLKRLVERRLEVGSPRERIHARATLARLVEQRARLTGKRVVTHVEEQQQRGNN